MKSWCGVGRALTRAGLMALLLGVLPSAAVAQTDDGFYKGKTVRLVLGTGVGGGYDIYGRLLARHLSNHLPGRPGIIVENMPGAGGLKVTNWLYAQAPRDGTVIGLVQLTVPLAPLLGQQGAQFDPLKFTWIGSMNREPGFCAAWHTSPIKTWQDMLDKEFIVGGTGAGSSTVLYPALLNMLLNTKIKVVTGYKDGSSVMLAIERGEISGVCGPFMASIKATFPHWITEKKLAVTIAVDRQRLPEYPDVPAIPEFIKDERILQVFEPTFAVGDMQRPILAPPGLPDARTQELRAALLATMNDPAFRQEAEKAQLPMDYVSGEQLLETIKRSYALPREAIELARKAMGNAP
jgi:tripartite-type tricarboxylate transporter receptor subunit TctC